MKNTVQSLSKTYLMIVAFQIGDEAHMHLLQIFILYNEQ